MWPSRLWYHVYLYTFQWSTFLWNYVICLQDYIVSQPRWPQCEQLLQWKSQNLYSPSKTNELLYTLRTVTALWVCESTVSFWCALHLYNVLCIISTNYLKLLHKLEVMCTHPYVSSQTLYNRYEWMSLWRINTNGQSGWLNSGVHQPKSYI